MNNGYSDDRHTNQYEFKRGPYKKHTTEHKEKALDMVQSGISVIRVSKIMGINTKNIRRWMMYGTDKKKGKYHIISYNHIS